MKWVWCLLVSIHVHVCCLTDYIHWVNTMIVRDIKLRPDQKEVVNVNARRTMFAVAVMCHLDPADIDTV